MNIYIYSEKTKEYLSTQPAEQDIAESQRQGHFVALVPQFATIVEAPDYEENEIPVYSKTVTEIEEEQEITRPKYDDEGKPITHEETVLNPIYNDDGEIIGYDEPTVIQVPETETITIMVPKKIITENWEVKTDFRKNFYRVDEDLNVFDITEIGEIEGIKVTKEIGDEIKADKSWFKIVDGEVVKKTEEEHTEEEFFKAKTAKYAENSQKGEIAREGQEFTMTFDEVELLFDTTRNTQQDLTLAKDALSAGVPEYPWFDNNGTEFAFTSVEQIAEIYVKFLAKANIYPKWAYFKNLIDTAETKEEIENIIIDYGINIGV